jgi:hypothetical protein
MTSLRLESVSITSSVSLTATFTQKLTTNLDAGNVIISSQTANVPDSKVIKVEVFNNTLKITCQPLTPYGAYNIIFRSTISKPFQSFYGDYKLIEDGISNLKLILGPPEPNNIIRDFLRNFLRDNIYNVEDPTTAVYKVIESFVSNFSKALYDTRQVKNENYLSNFIENEEKTRGEGPYDRLDEEGAYEVTRVALTPSGNFVSGKYNIESFPSYPFTLQSTQVNREVLLVNSVDVEGAFNINNLILNLKNNPVTKLTKLVFTQSVTPVIYEYDLDIYGYQIKNNTYDQDHAFPYLLLEDNQLKLNDQILQDPNFKIDSILRVECYYQYKDLGKLIYENSLRVENVLTSSRETLPAIINIFDLKHAPIVDLNNEISQLGGVIFVDPNSGDINGKHPAFLYELPFRLEYLPSAPGYYSVDYSTGRVYVYGATGAQDGTGASPPVATYNYRLTYQNEIDYVYDSDTKDIVSLPKGNMRDNSVILNFNYEKVLIPNTDYVAKVHQESLQERVDNRLLNLGTIKTLNSPVTNVFRIYNETSGELYAINRWLDDKIYFDYNIAPKVNNQTLERANFELVLNELMFVSAAYQNSSSVTIFKILLNNNNIVALSEDCIASSINSSASFSNKFIFVHEKYFQKNANEQVNVDNLTNVGEYCIDYVNGIIYCAVLNTQDYNIGSISYRKNNIITNDDHIISVNDIYYQVSPILPKNKNFNYLSFGDNSIVTDGVQYSDEYLYNNDPSFPYQVLNSTIGFFDQAIFYGKVSEQIKYIRGIFENNDLKNNLYPINFSSFASFDGNKITISPISNSLISQIIQDGSNFYVNLPQNSSYLSPNISYDISIVRNSDGYQLWDTGGQIIPGTPTKLLLSGINNPQSGQVVNLNYNINIDNLSYVTVDYNKGDFYVDYTYLVDEIIVSYEYGDNVLDFRQSNAISQNTTYYASYRSGALRDALLKNFGSLLFVPELNVFNVNLDRERYRDALTGALSSFLLGPTVDGIKNLVNKITHIDPEIIESVFNTWSLGNSLLYPNKINSTGNFQLIPVKFNNGALIDSPDQTITLPRSSNLSLNQGTFETWILPQWNGIDNNSKLSFTVSTNNAEVSSKIDNFIFIGDGEYHPELTNGTFTIDKNTNASGIPQKNKNGVYIYYAPDSSKLFDRWYVDVIDNVADGYKYTIQINSDGSFYDVKKINSLSDISTTTTGSKLSIKINNSTSQSQLVTFISDYEHYLLDSGEESKNRISIFKDISGYLNFKVFDKFKNSYTVSADVSNWKKNEKHFIAASWKLNTDNNKDEMHLFIDGFEVPNIIKYGQKLLPYPHEKFRTVNPETLVGLSNKNIVGSIDLSTVLGSNVVKSSLNFVEKGINVGDIIYIQDPLFNSSGYVIDIVNYEGNGSELHLNSPMPATLNNLTYSINKTSYNLKLDANAYPNVAVAKLSVVYDSQLMGVSLSTVINNEVVTSSPSSNFNEIKPGYLLRILNTSFDLTYNILAVDGYHLTLDQKMPATVNDADYFIYSNAEIEIPGVKALYPSYQISSDQYFNSILTIIKDVSQNDLILLNTFGLNHRTVKQSHYVWGDLSENIVQTRLPPPISLDDVKIIKTVVTPKIINSSNSSIIGSELQFITTDAFYPSGSEYGRTLTFSIYGTNVDFSTPVNVVLDGYNLEDFTETISFNDYGKIDTVNKYIRLKKVTINCTPININKDCLAFDVKEKYSLIYSEDSSLAPVIRYSYQMSSGISLKKTGTNIVTDENNFFSFKDNNNYLIIPFPVSVAGVYKIIGVSEDHKSLTIETFVPLADFSDANYQIINVTDYRTGLQNGFFVFEQTQFPGEPYFLNKGYYDFEYQSYASIRLDPLSNENIYLGSDIFGKKQINAAIDQVKIYSTMLSDTRVGQTLLLNQRSVTRDYNSLVPLTSDVNTLALINFDEYPFKNDADFYIKHIGNKYIQSDVSINNNFENSIVLNKSPIVLDNYGILDTGKEGTIEFWVNPLFDFQNDPNYRYYFDAYGAKVISTISSNNSEVIIDEIAEKIISVTLESGNQSVDYFAGGNLQISYSDAISEDAVSDDNSTVRVAGQILQVISVTIDGDLSKENYFNNGAIGLDKKTIYLGKPLPSSNLSLIVIYKPLNNSDNKINSQVIKLNKKLPKDNTPVLVKFIPKGFKGDRMSIYKDPEGYLNFEILASNQSYKVSAPLYWARDTWHRVKVTFKINGQVTTDELRLFVDGYERSNLLINGQINFGSVSDIGAANFGVSIGNQNISFKDKINQIYIGSDYSKNGNAYCLIDNLRISNIARPAYKPYGESLDPAYSSNMQTAFPVTKDLYTTYLLDFNSSITKNEDFTFIVAKEGSYFDFTVNIFDSFGIVSSSDIVKEILEKLIYSLKPANSKAYLQYYK